MKVQHYASWFSLLLTAALPLACPCGSGAAPAAADAAAAPVLLPIPKTSSPGFSDMVIEPGGTVWIMANTKLFYWAGNEFREPVSGPMGSGIYLAGLYGGPDRGAYATQPGKGEHEGVLYRLSDGTATRVASFHYEVAHNYPGIYVAKSGDIFNWGYRFLARLGSNGWDRVEARLSLDATCVFDLGEHVYFYYDNHLYCGGKDGLRELQPPSWHGAQPGVNRISGVRWGKTGALILDYGRRGLFAFDLESCQEVPLHAANQELSNVDLYTAFSLPDGSAWLLGHGRNGYGLGGYMYFSLGTNGTVKPLVETREVPWDNTMCWQFPDSVLVTSGGAIVFGLPEDGLAIWRDGKVERYGYRQGFTSRVFQIMEDPRGNLWAPVATRIVRFRLDAPAPREKGSSR